MVLLISQLILQSTMFVCSSLSSSVKVQNVRLQRRLNLRVQAEVGWNKVLTKKELAEKGGRAVVNVSGNQILVQEFAGDIYAVSNRCTHLNLPLQGRTALLSAEVTDDGCVVCPAHGTAFELKSGEVKGDWCPKFNIPFVGKLTEQKPLPVYELRVTDDESIEIKA
eukprot:TRINITY_DN868_c1_g1_i2.p2 TRINITY_DN868_c1_g1~~TRINITY_DN868_c1_g1_i2.p2  ORF type:complete len:166 (-),score=26.34 TRINITY_DN868_c1_g1_i2:555-1052(-)